jgi:hypothetical protein
MSAPPPADGSPPEKHHHDLLTDAERQELDQAHESGIRVNPDLAAEGKDLMKKNGGLAQES